jgi:signal transduction histidine kinase
MNTLIKAYKNIISLFVALIFLCQSIVIAEPLMPPQSVMDISKATNHIRIPEQYGRIENLTELSSAGSDKTVILVKDAHCNFEAQMNIAKILDILIKDYGIKLVGIEGASGKVDPSVALGSGNAKKGEEISKKYVKNGYLTASEALAIQKGKDFGFSIWGVEDLKLYLNNWQAFRDVYKGNELMQRFLSVSIKNLKELKSKLYPSSLLEFDQKVSEYKDNKSSLTEFIDYLYKKHTDSFMKYKNLKIVYKAINLEKHIDFNKVEKQRTSIIKNIEKSRTKDEVEVLVKNSLLYRMGQISALEYYSYLAKFMNLNDKKLYPDFRHYVSNLKLHSNIDENALFDELDELIEDIYSGLISGDIVVNLHKIDNHIYLFGKLAALEITKKDLAKCMQNKDLSVSFIINYLKIQCVNNGLNVPPEFTDNDFMRGAEGFCKNPEKFYEYALARDKAITENMLLKMENDKQNISVLVVGGFHAEGVKKLLKNEGVNFITITPSITKEDIEAKKIYLSRMLDEKASPEKMIGELGLNNISPAVLTAFCWGNDPVLKGYLQRIQSESLRTALKESKTEGELKERLKTVKKDEITPEDIAVVEEIIKLKQGQEGADVAIEIIQKALLIKDVLGQGQSKEGVILNKKYLFEEFEDNESAKEYVKKLVASVKQQLESADENILNEYPKLEILFKGVLYEIIANAYDAIVAERKIHEDVKGIIEVEIKIIEKDGNIVVQVSDNGIGIAKDKLEKLSTREFIGSEKKPGEGFVGGRGEGLLITQSNIGWLGGKIIIDTFDGKESGVLTFLNKTGAVSAGTRVVQGTTVTFEIPIKNLQEVKPLTVLQRVEAAVTSLKYTDTEKTIHAEFKEENYRVVEGWIDGIPSSDLSDLEKKELKGNVDYMAKLYRVAYYSFAPNKEQAVKSTAIRLVKSNEAIRDIQKKLPELYETIKDDNYALMQALIIWYAYAAEADRISKLNEFKDADKSGRESLVSASRNQLCPIEKKAEGAGATTFWTMNKDEGSFHAARLIIDAFQNGLSHVELTLDYAPFDFSKRLPGEVSKTEREQIRILSGLLGIGITVHSAILGTMHFVQGKMYQTLYDPIDNIDLVKQQIDACKDINAKDLVVHIVDLSKVEEYADLVIYAYNKGVTLALENYITKDGKFHTSAEVAQFFRNVAKILSARQPAALSVLAHCFDSAHYNLTAEQEDPLECAWVMVKLANELAEKYPTFNRFGFIKELHLNQNLGPIKFWVGFSADIHANISHNGPIWNEGIIALFYAFGFTPLVTAEQIPAVDSADKRLISEAITNNKVAGRLGIDKTIKKGDVFQPISRIFGNDRVTNHKENRELQEVLTGNIKATRHTIHEVQQKKVYESGEVIIKEGDSADALFFITEGSVNVVKNGVVVATLTRGDVLGEMALETGTARTATAVAGETGAIIIRIEKDFYEKLKSRFPDFASQIKGTVEKRMKAQAVAQEKEAARQITEVTGTVYSEIPAVLKQVAAEVLKQYDPKIPSQCVKASIAIEKALRERGISARQRAVNIPHDCSSMLETGGATDGHTIIEVEFAGGIWVIDTQILQFTQLDRNKLNRSNDFINQYVYPASYYYALVPCFETGVVLVGEEIKKSLVKTSAVLAEEEGKLPEGGLIGKYQVLGEPVYDKEKSVVRFRARNIETGEIEDIELKAKSVDREYVGSKLSAIYGATENELITSITDWFLSEFIGDIVLLEDNEYGIKGIGSKKIIGFYEGYQNESIAIFHEIAEAMGSAGQLSYETILSALKDRAWYDQHMSKGGREGLELHYAIRALQREILTRMDSDFTLVVKGRLSKMEINRFISAKEKESKVRLRRGRIVHEFSSARRDLQNKEQELKLLNDLIAVEIEFCRQEEEIIARQAEERRKADEALLRQQEGIEEIFREAESAYGKYAGEEKSREVLVILDRLSEYDSEIVAKAFLKRIEKRLSSRIGFIDPFNSFIFSAVKNQKSIVVGNIIAGLYSSIFNATRYLSERQTALSEFALLLRSIGAFDSDMLSKINDLLIADLYRKSKLRISVARYKVQDIPEYENLFDFDPEHPDVAYFKDKFVHRVVWIRDVRQRKILDKLYSEALFDTSAILQICSSIMASDKTGYMVRSILGELSKEGIDENVKVFMLSLLAANWNDNLSNDDLMKVLQSASQIYNENKNSKIRRMIIEILKQMSQYNSSMTGQTIVDEIIKGRMRSINVEIADNSARVEELRNRYSQIKKDKYKYTKDEIDDARRDFRDAIDEQDNLMGEMQLCVDIVVAKATKNIDSGIVEQKQYAELLINYLVELVQDTSLNINIRSEIISKMFQPFVSKGVEPVVRYLLGQLEMDIGDETKNKILNIMTSAQVSDDEIIDILKNSKLNDRTRYLIVLRYMNNDALLEKVISDDEIDITARIYAFNCYCAKYLESVVKGEYGEEVVYNQEKLGQLIDKLAEKAEVFIRSNLHNNIRTTNLIDDIVLQDEEAKVYAMAVFIVLQKRIKNYGAEAFIKTAKLMFNSIVRIYWNNANSNFILGGEILRGKSEASTLLFQILAHEIMHDILDYGFNYRSINLSRKIIHELMSDIQSFALSEAVGMDMNVLVNDLDYEANYESVAEDSLHTVEGHEGARAQLKIIMEVFKSNGLQIDWQKLLSDAMVVLSDKNNQEKSASEIVKLIIKKYINSVGIGEQEAAETSFFNSSLLLSVLGLKHGFSYDVDESEIRQKLLSRSEIEDAVSSFSRGYGGEDSTDKGDVVPLALIKPSDSYQYKVFWGPLKEEIIYRGLPLAVGLISIYLSPHIITSLIAFVAFNLISVLFVVRHQAGTRGPAIQVSIYNSIITSILAVVLALIGQPDILINSIGFIFTFTGYFIVHHKINKKQLEMTRIREKDTDKTQGWKLYSEGTDVCPIMDSSVKNMREEIDLRKLPVGTLVRIKEGVSRVPYIIQICESNMIKLWYEGMKGCYECNIEDLYIDSAASITAGLQGKHEIGKIKVGEFVIMPYFRWDHNGNLESLEDRTDGEISWPANADEIYVNLPAEKINSDQNIQEVVEVRAKAINGSDITISLDRKGVVEDIDAIAKKHGLIVRFSGGVARRMVLGRNPVDESTDFDLMVRVPGKDFESSNKLKLTEDEIQKIRAFENELKLKYPTSAIDIINISYDSGELEKEYWRVRETRVITLDRLLISKVGDQWIVDDESGGAYLEDIERKRFRLVPGSAKGPWLDYEGVLRFVRVWAEFSVVDTERDPESNQEVFDFIKSKNYGEAKWDQVLTIEDALQSFKDGDRDWLDRRMIPPVKSLLKIFIHAKDLDTVIDLLYEFGTPERNLATIYGEIIDLNKVVEIVRNGGGMTGDFSDFDTAFRDLADKDYARQFSEEDLINYLKEAFKNSVLTEAEQQYIAAFVHEQKLDWLDKTNKMFIGERMIERSVLLYSWPKEIRKYASAQMASRGYGGEDNAEFTVDIRNALGLDENGDPIEGAKKDFVSVKVDENGETVGEDIGVMGSGELTDIEKDILRTVSQGLDLHDIAIVFMAFRDVNMAHYGLSRKQIYLDRRMLTKENQDSLRRRLVHELQERTSVIEKMNSQYPGWEAKREDKGVKDGIAKIAQEVHLDLVAEEIAELLGLGKTRPVLDQLVNILKGEKNDFINTLREMLIESSANKDILQKNIDVIFSSAETVMKILHLLEGDLPNESIEKIRESLAVYLSIQQFEAKREGNTGIPQFMDNLTKALIADGNDEKVVRSLLKDLWDVEGYYIEGGDIKKSEYFRLMLDGIRVNFNITKDSEADKYLNILNNYKFRVAQIKSKFNVSEVGFVSDGDEVFTVLNAYLKLRNDQALDKIVDVVARYMAYGTDDNEILNMFEAAELKSQVKNGIESIIKRKQLIALESVSEKDVKKLPRFVAENSPEGMTAELLAQKIQEEFGIRIETKEGMYQAKLREKDAEKDWTMNDFREESVYPIADTMDAVPVVKLAYPLDVSPVISMAGTNCKGLFLCFIEGVEHPVAIKLLTHSSAIEKFDNLNEIIRMQVFDCLGVGPRFYGIVKDLPGDLIGVVMDVVPGKDVRADGAGKFSECFRRCIRAGITPSSLMQTPATGTGIVIDAGSSDVHDQESFQQYVADSKKAPVRNLVANTIILSEITPQEDFNTIVDELGQRVVDSKSENYYIDSNGNEANAVFSKDGVLDTLEMDTKRVSAESVIDLLKYFGRKYLVLGKDNARKLLNIFTGYVEAGKLIDKRFNLIDNEWQADVPLVVEAKLLVGKVNSNNGKYAITPMGEAGVWLLREAHKKGMLSILYDENNPIEKEAVRIWLEEHGIVISEKEFITSYTENSIPKDAKYGISLLSQETVDKFNLKKLSDKHRIISGKADDSDMLLMSRMAMVLSSDKVDKNAMERLFFAYYDVNSVDKLNEQAKAVLEAIAQGGSLILSLPPVAPFVKAYLNSLKTATEIVASAA